MDGGLAGVEGGGRVWAGVEREGLGIEQRVRKEVGEGVARGMGRGWVRGDGRDGEVGVEGVSLAPGGWGAR